YTYSRLGSVSRTYPVPKPVKLNARDIAKELAAPASRPPTAAASAGSQSNNASPSGKPTAKPATSSAAPITLPVKPPAPKPAVMKKSSTARKATAKKATAPMVKERLFANPARAGSYAAGGDLQLKNASQQISSFQSYFSDALHLGRNQYTLKPLKAGSIVVAGTILGRIGGPSQNVAPHLYFQIRPAGKNAPLIA